MLKKNYNTKRNHRSPRNKQHIDQKHIKGITKRTAVTQKTKAMIKWSVVILSLGSHIIPETSFSCDCVGFLRSFVGYLACCFDGRPVFNLLWICLKRHSFYFGHFALYKNALRNERDFVVDEYDLSLLSCARSICKWTIALLNSVPP